MKREFKFLVKKEGFKGNADAIAYEENGVWFVDCTGYLYNNNGPDLTPEQYSKLKNEEYEILTWEEMETKYVTPYLKSLQGPFTEVTFEEYENALECLPPKRWTRTAGNPEFFFLGECFTHSLYSCFMMWKGKCYSALRDINTPKEILVSDFLLSIAN